MSSHTHVGSDDGVGQVGEGQQKRKSKIESERKGDGSIVSTLSLYTMASHSIDICPFLSHETTIEMPTLQEIAEQRNTAARSRSNKGNSARLIPPVSFFMQRRQRDKGPNARHATNNHNQFARPHLSYVCPIIPFVPACRPHIARNSVIVER
jgi:hypothetical protein